MITILYYFRITITNRGKVSFNYAWQVNMEDNQRPFTPMIDRDPPTPEPIDSSRKGAKGGARAQGANISVADSITTQESVAPQTGAKGKDKSGKDAGKSTGKEGQTGSKGKGTRASVKASVTAENLAEEKESENDMGKDVIFQTDYPDD